MEYGVAKDADVITVTEWHRLRDASGDFACPWCYEHLKSPAITRLKFGAETCHNCGGPLVWNVSDRRS